ncbi:hypothetical protein BU17DRAFT_92897 [Hysterangium stoloniferum]|nr:hypothetical protein BU17DRAFT_92897 [Hysterangium stoloniferum]
MWKPSILARFQRLPDDTTIENKFYGVYNTILTQECFTEDIFTVEPQYALPRAQVGGIGAINFVVSFVVEVEDAPVLFVEIKPPTHLKYRATRTDADREMRSRFEELFEMCRTPTLYGVSAMGKKLCIYKLDVANYTIAPQQLPTSSMHVVDSAPESRWDLDITNQDGFQKFMEIVADVKRMVEA